ncbi:MAG: ABC transporter permease subunit [Deltaproteobacteria bacterium]|nr:ABC transporter permease subunit [Deltaproteobacteria bacterium]
MRIQALLTNTVRQAIRDRILYSLLVFGILMILSSVVIGRLSLGEDVKIIKDFGLGCVSLFGVLIAIFVGVDLVYREVTSRTVYTLLSKPIRRWEFLLGEYLGLMLTVLMNVVVMALCLELIVGFRTGGIDLTLFSAIGLMVFEFMLIASIAIFFSTFLSRTLSTFMTLAVYVSGHMTHDLVDLGKQTESLWMERVALAIYYLLPDLEAFNIRSQVVEGVKIASADLWTSVAYGMLYLVGVFLIALKIFQHKDFR